MPKTDETLQLTGGAADRFVMTIRLGPNPPTSGGDVAELGLHTGGTFRSPADGRIWTVKVPIVGGAAPDTFSTVIRSAEETGIGGAAPIPIGLIHVDLNVQTKTLIHDK